MSSNITILMTEKLAIRWNGESTFIIETNEGIDYFEQPAKNLNEAIDIAEEYYNEYLLF